MATLAASTNRQPRADVTRDLLSVRRPTAASSSSDLPARPAKVLTGSAPDDETGTHLGHRKRALAGTGSGEWDDASGVGVELTSPLVPGWIGMGEK